MRTYDHWGHGVSTVVEFPDRAKSVLHWGGGTAITQEKDPEDRKNNWFHLPVPTPTSQSDDPIYLDYLHLRAEVNENARIAEAHIWMDNSRIHTEDCNWVGQYVNERIKLPEERQVMGSINLCIRVEFLSGEPLGRVDFYGVGGRFLS